MTELPRDGNAWDGKVVAVTAAGAGIGEAVALWFGARGATVFVLDLDGVAADRTARAITRAGGSAVSGACDAGDEADILAAFEEIDRRLGRIDVLVNNAGINIRQRPFDVEMTTWNRVFAVNVTGHFLCAREAARRMASSGGGAIVSVSSIAARSALGRGNLAYSASKGAIESMVRELAIEWAALGIRVNAVAPCQVATESFVTSEHTRAAAGDTAATDYHRGIPVGHPARPSDIADAVGFLASPAAAMVTGTVLAVDGGNLAYNAGGTIGAGQVV